MDVPSQATSSFARMIEEEVVVYNEGHANLEDDTVAMATNVAIMALAMVEDIK